MFVRLAARSVRQRVLVTTSVVHLLNDACFAILYPLFPLIAADLGLSSNIHRYAVGPEQVQSYRTSSGAAVLLPMYDVILEIMKQALSSPS